mmetsp:Transcript_11627/g.15813  ORF Transcript_11627/g.15813 Transcript_11627/m.15813 type:complete len:232 (-) Transcript_11627:365-1060(-)
MCIFEINSYPKNMSFNSCAPVPSLESEICFTPMYFDFIQSGAHFYNPFLPEVSYEQLSIDSLDPIKPRFPKALSYSKGTKTRVRADKWCRVNGCQTPSLHDSPPYCARHRVCPAHLKSLQVVMDGVPNRFCQKCTRFHQESAFDGQKRNCRHRLEQERIRRLARSNKARSEDGHSPVISDAEDFSGSPRAQYDEIPSLKVDVILTEKGDTSFTWHPDAIYWQPSAPTIEVG